MEPREKRRTIRKRDDEQRKIKKVESEEERGEIVKGWGNLREEGEGEKGEGRRGGEGGK